MLIETDKELLKINQIVGQKSENIVLQEDFVVPDIKPDILNVLNSSGIVCIYKKEIMDNKIKIDGTVNCYVIYYANDEKNNIRSMNVNLDFSKILDCEKINKDMILEDEINIKQIECVVLNERKITLKVILDVNLKYYLNEEVEVIKDVKNVRSIKVLNEQLNVNSLIGNGCTKIYAKDTIVIDNMDNLVEILKSSVEIKNIETKISYNKVLVKADTNVKLMYLTEDNRIKTISNNIPTMGFIDVEKIEENNLCDIKFEIKNVIIKPNNMEDHSIYVEVEYEVCTNVYEDKKINLICDLYSINQDLVYKEKKINVLTKFNITKDILSIREKQYIEEILDSQIYDTDINVIIINKNILKDKIIFEGQIEIKYLYKDKQNLMLNVKNIIVPFNYNMNINGIDEKAQIEVNTKIIKQDFSVLPDLNIDVKIDIEFLVKSINTFRMNVIDELSLEENRKENDYSVIVYFVKSGDTLWKIAKKFKSTIEDIVKINNIEDENKIFVGEQLFIPFVNY